MMVTYLLRVLPYLRPYWRLGIGSVWLTIGATLFGLLSPWPLKVLVDNVIGGAPLPPVIGGLLGGFESHPLLLLTLSVLAGLLIAVVGGGLHVLNSYVNTKLEQHIIGKAALDPDLVGQPLVMKLRLINCIVGIHSKIDNINNTL